MDYLNDNDFVFIERFLLSFKELGGDERGVIDYDLFKTNLRQKGDIMTDILHLINEEHCVTNNSLHYFKLCASLLATKAAFNLLSLENGRIRDAHVPINTRTYTRKKSSSQASISSSSAGENSKTENFKQQIRGSVYYVTEDALSNRYHMEVLETSCIELFAKSTNPAGDLREKFPVELLILEDKNKAFITSSSFTNSEGCCTVKYHFKKGKYIVVPVLLTWPAKENATEAVNLASLIDLNDDGQVVLTTGCERALKFVFDTIDLDKNGLLSQLEFDLFIQYTSGETAADEWSTIEDNFQMEDHQLTFDGFVELYKMVLQTDPADVTTMFQLMGMNAALEQQNVQPFTLYIKAEASQFLLSPLPVATYKLAVEKGLCKAAVEQGASKKVKNMNDLYLYILQLPHRVTIVIQNQSHSKVTVRLDCTQSTNCRSHRNVLDYTLEVLPRTSIVGHHLFAINPKEKWSFDCIDELKKSN